MWYGDIAPESKNKIVLRSPWIPFHQPVSAAKIVLSGIGMIQERTQHKNPKLNYKVSIDNNGAGLFDDQLPVANTSKCRYLRQLRRTV
jgi:hypothetical protein